MQFTKQEQKYIARGFYLSLCIKGFISVAEIMVGILVLFVPVSYITDLILKTMPKIPFASLVEGFASVSNVFIATYLLSRGFVKIFLVICLIKNKLWAYPASLMVLTLFMVYQIYQIITTLSIAIFALTVFDAVVMWFIWEEYRMVRSRLEKNKL